MITSYEIATSLVSRKLASWTSEAWNLCSIADTVIINFLGEDLCKLVDASTEVHESLRDCCLDIDASSAMKPLFLLRLFSLDLHRACSPTSLAFVRLDRNTTRQAAINRSCQLAPNSILNRYQALLLLCRKIVHARFLEIDYVFVFNSKLGGVLPSQSWETTVR